MPGRDHRPDGGVRAMGVKQAKASGLTVLADGNPGRSSADVECCESFRRMAQDNYIHQRTYRGA
jgi:hypothetical protein